MARLFLRALVLAAALSFVAVYAIAAADALRGSRPADPIERSILDQSARFAHRDLALVEPEDPRAPVAMPGFAALVALLVGADMPGLELVRALALTATLLTALLLLCLVHFETGSWTLSIAAASCALVGQGLFATAPGLARPEALLFLGVLLAFAALRILVGVAGSLLAGVLLGAAFFADAGALVFLAAALVSQALDERRRLWTLAVASGAVIAAGTILLLPHLGPGLSAAAWSAPFARLVFDPRAALDFTASVLLGKLGLFSLGVVLSYALASEPWRDREGLWIWLGVAAVVAGALASQDARADGAALVSSVVAFTLLGTLALQRVAHHLADRAGRDGHGGEAALLAAL
ncbi:MAG: hypothetical protein ABIP29_03560, partial [Candidatus Eisenbacteria bacterium]